ncbi:DUF262 and DUF1524 domain-containing protein [Pedobacter kyonggii]|uniref:DUF262 domain-containing protein n=1 Tax=Pedobacter kyonggii TaxID=1926871 RepID=A0A4Q9HCT9_9SPHI|nr:DUF262 and DUF1524 domain-containing protein [Pedobacter kyonggii]TBO42252.1 DUF262 domain-containing protein [Pedobacter kyonggii]
MKAISANILSVIKGPKQFVIPIYQRTYSWHTSQCRQLLSDIIKTGSQKGGEGHFLGSLVYFQESIYNTTDVPQLLIIDGQQRVTSISLLLLALSEFIDSHPLEIETTANKIKNYYLLNAEEEGELRYKLLLTRKDKETYIALLNGTPLPENYSSRLYENYLFFKDQIDEEKVIDIYNGIMQLFVVDVTLEKDKDNPQLIFESMNSTGLDLSQADLIRNYILMGQNIKDQVYLYDKYWFPMEQNYGNEYGGYFDKFMRDFLSAKTETIPNIDKVYSSFKVFASDQSIEDVVSELTRYSGFYANMVLQKEKDPALLAAFRNLSVLKVDVAYPFLLLVYNDYIDGIIDKTTFLSVIALVENYVVRRAICGIATNSMNKTFLILYRSIQKESYLESLAATMQLFVGSKLFPNDSDFISQLKIKDIYNFRSKGYLLNRLENYNRKELVNTNEYSIEHIMPQNENLRKEWKEMLGPDYLKIREIYLHTLGNLTLTRYNSELSDKPYGFKKTTEGGFDTSPLNLNQFLRTSTVWNREKIEKRAQILAETAAKIWAHPNLSQEALSPYLIKEKIGASEYSIDQFEHLKGNVFSLYERLKKSILALDEAVKEEYKKQYIAFKTSTNFVDIVPQKSRLKLSLNLPFSEIVDPKGICKDISNLGRWGNGDVEVGVSPDEDLNYIMYLIEQSLDYQNN